MNKNISSSEVQHAVSQRNRTPHMGPCHTDDSGWPLKLSNEWVTSQSKRFHVCVKLFQNHLFNCPLPVKDYKSLQLFVLPFVCLLSCSPNESCFYLPGKESLSPLLHKVSQTIKHSLSSGLPSVIKVQCSLPLWATEQLWRSNWRLGALPKCLDNVEEGERGSLS